MTEIALIKLIIVVLLSLLFFLVVGIIFRMHMRDIIAVLPKELKTKKGMVSFFGFVILAMIHLDSEAMLYMLYLISPESQASEILNHASSSQTTFLWASGFCFSGNFILLAIFDKDKDKDKEA